MTNEPLCGIYAVPADWPVLRQNLSIVEVHMMLCFFSQRVVNVGNDLAADVVTASTVWTFKNQLDVHLKISRNSRQSNLNGKPHSSILRVFLLFI